MKVVIASDSFKESLSAVTACQAIRRGLDRALGGAEYDLAPMADGGEGTVDAMVHATSGEYVSATVRGPLGEPVQARYGILGDGESAVIEMAAASGLPLVPTDRRDPMVTTTYGTGELIRSALDRGVRRIIIGIGGSATTDGGAGAVQALGARLLDENGRQIAPGGAGLGRLAAIDLSGLDPRIAETEILVASDVANPLTGPDGAAYVYGPQKGATEQTVGILDENLKRYAQVIRTHLNIDVDPIPGAGAAGGLGAGLLAFCKARLAGGAKLVADSIALDGRMAGADLCITGEGQLDGSSRFGKVCFHVAALARGHNIPAIALVGSIGHEAEKNVPPLTAFFSIVDRPMELSEAIGAAEVLMERLAEQVGRMVSWAVGGKKRAEGSGQ